MAGLLGNKRILLILVAVIIGAGGAFGAFTVLSGGKSDQATPTPKPKEETAGPGPIYQIKDRVVNLSDQGGRRFLKIGVAVELKAEKPDFYQMKGEARAKVGEELKKELTPIEPVINDIMTSLVSSKTVEDVTTVQGKDRLKRELKDKLEKPFQSFHQEIVNIYFTEFVVQ